MKWREIRNLIISVFYVKRNSILYIDQLPKLIFLLYFILINADWIYKILDHPETKVTFITI